jgi:hypothetical protein
MLGTRGFPSHIEEGYLDVFARKALPGGDLIEIKQLKATLRLALKTEQATRLAESRQEQETPTRKPTRKLRKRSALVGLRKQVRAMHEAHMSQKEMCERLAGKPRPLGARWRHLDWPDAIIHPTFGSAVKKWLTQAAR